MKYKHLLVFLLFLLLFTGSISEIISLSHDSVYYVDQIENGDWVFHPHHFIYHVFAQLFYNVCSLISSNVSVSWTVSFLNSIFGALGLVVFFDILLNKGIENKMAMFATLSAGLSFGYWFYSGVVEVYIIPVFFILLAIRALNKENHNYLELAFYTGLATLFHQTYIFLAFIMAAIYLRNKAYKDLMKYAIYYTSLVVIPYLLAMYFHEGIRSVSEGFLWLTKYGHTEKQFWASTSITTIIKNDTIGFGRSILNNHFILAVDGIGEYFYNKFSYQWLYAERYLVRNLNPGFAFAILITAVISGLSFAVLFVRMIFKIIKAKSDQFLFVKLFLLVYIIFFTLWSAWNPEFWISISTLSWLMIYLFFSEDKYSKLILVLLPSLLFITNYFGSIQYVNDIDNDFYIKKVEPLKKEISNEEVIVSSYELISKHYYLQAGYEDLILSIDIYNQDKDKYEKNFKSKIDSVLKENGKIYLSWEMLEIDKNKYEKNYIESTEKVLQTYTLNEVRLNDEAKYYEIKNNLKD